MIKLGIISLAHPHSTGNHLPALKYMKNRVQVAGICHTDPAAAKPWLDTTGAKLYGSRDELLADAEIDAVLITSQNLHHAEDSMAAALAGKDVFCDKPIGLNALQCKEIVEAVRQNGVTFLTTFPVRFNTAVQQAKKAIQEGALGELQAIMATNHGCMYEPGVPAWVLDPAANGGGCLIDHTVHVADIIRWFTGQEFETVYVQARTAALHSELNAEDIAVLHGKMDGGLVYQIDASWNRRKNDPMWGDVTFRIVGSKGSISLDLYNNQYLDVYTGGQSARHYPNLIVYEHGQIFEDYRAFKEEGCPLVGANELDGLRTIELVDAGYESVRLGKAVEVTRVF